MSKEPFPEKLGRRTAELSIRFRWLLLSLCVLASMAFGMAAGNLQFAGDYRVFFGDNNPDFIASQNAEATFGKPDNVAFVLIPKSGNVFTEDTLTAVHALTEKSWLLPSVSRVDSLTNFQSTWADGDELIVEPLVDDPGKLTVQGIERIRSIALSEPLLNGSLVSRNADATIVSATVQISPDIPNAALAVTNVAREMRDEILKSHPDHDIHLIGVATFSAAFEEAGLRDSATLIPAVYLLILIVMFLALRSISAVFSTLAVIAISTFIGLGAGGLSGVELTPISISAPTIILTIAVADAIHILSGIRRQISLGASKRDAIIRSTALNFTPIAITSVTTVIGFLTLNFSDSPPFHDLGNMSAAGIAAAWLLSVTFLPALLSTLPIKFKAHETKKAKAGLVENLAEFVIRRPRRVLLTVAGTAAVLIAFIPTIEINDQWSQYFDESLEIRQAIDTTKQYFGSETIEFVLDPGEPGGIADPAFLATVDEFAAWLRSREAEVAHVFSITDILRRLNMNLNADDPGFFQLPDERALASQYLLVYELSLPYGLDLNNRVDIDRQSTRVTVTMNDISTTDTKAFIRDARSWFDANGNGYDLQTTGSMVLFAFVAERNIEAMFDGAGYLILVILAVLSLTFRSLSVGLVSLIPNVLPIAAAFGFWAILVGTVGFSIAAVGAVAVGLVVDFTVHFLSKYFRARRHSGESVEEAIRYAFQTAGSAIFLTTVVLAAGFSLLVNSTFKLNADLGLLTAIAVVLAMLVNLLLLPAMLLVTRKQEQSSAIDAPSPPQLEGV